MKTLQDKIQELENDGWKYEHEHKVSVKDNTCMMCMALVKDNKYRMIKGGKIHKEQSIMTDSNYEQFENAYTENRRSFRLSDTDMEHLATIAQHYFGTATNNNTAALKLLIEQEYKRIKGVK